MNNNNYILFQQAKELIKKRKYKDATRILRQINQSEPNDNIVKFELAKLLAKDKYTTKEAEKSFKELINIGSSKDRTYALLELGRLYASVGKENEAEKSFKELLNTQSRTYALLELGRLYESVGKENEAEKCFKELINIGSSKDRSYAMLELGRLYASNGNEELARKIFLEILTLENNEYAIKQLIYLDIKNNNLEEILDLLMKLSIQDKEYYEIKTYVLYKLGKTEQIEAKNYYTQQLMNYDEYAALEHIKKHLDENENKRLHTVFDSSIDLQQLFEQAKEKIKVINPTAFTIVEKYIICFEETIGISEGEKVKTIEVVTIPHTKNIITMYPIKVTNLEKEKQFKIEL